MCRSFELRNDDRRYCAVIQVVNAVSRNTKMVKSEDDVSILVTSGDSKGGW